MASVGIGLIGTGYMGKCHALAYNAVGPTFGDVPELRLEILADRTDEIASQRSAEFRFARHSTDWRDVVADPKVDVVAITTPNALHREMALAAIDAGKHVYCEKPMGLSLQDAIDMAEAARRAGVKTLIGYNYLHNPAVLHAKALIDDGAIGRIVGFRGFFDEDYLADPDLPYSWRCRVDEAGTGALGDMACHLVSIAHFLVGPIAAVMGDIHTEHDHRVGTDGSAQSGGAVETEDLAHALLRFRSGVRGTLASSRIAWGRKNHLAWEIHGSTGMITFDQEQMNELMLFRNDGDPARHGFTRILSAPVHRPFGQITSGSGHSIGFNDLKIVEVVHLLRGLTGQQDLHPDFEDGLAIERVIHGIARSSVDQRWVEV